MQQDLRDYPSFYVVLICSAVSDKVLLFAPCALRGSLKINCDYRLVHGSRGSG